MSAIIPVSLEDLIHARAIESVRLEFKAGWSEPTLDQVIRSICAFANDFQGVGGGYIILGIAEKEKGKPELPPQGLEGLDLDRIQKEIRGQCQHIDPPYQPILFPTFFDNHLILVIWARRSDARPHQAPAGRKNAERNYYIRVGSETTRARGELLTQLMQLTSRIPFDDRQSGYPIREVSPSLLVQYLRDIRSQHAEAASADPAGVLRGMGLSIGSNGSEQLRNAALLFFCESPHNYLRGASIELAQFRDGQGGDLIETTRFVGPLHHQVRGVIEFFQRKLGDVTRKLDEQIEAERFVAFPEAALREAVVNAVYHRGYDAPQIPVRIGLYPDRVEITSYPGPVPGLEHAHLEPAARIPQLPARNPHVGDLLRALGLAETWHTGIPRIYAQMRDNSSPAPRFDFDEQRTYFRVSLPAHPGYVALQVLREAALDWHTGNHDQAISRLKSARRAAPASGPLAAQLIEYLANEDKFPAAEAVLAEVRKEATGRDLWLAARALANAYLRRNERKKALTLLASVAPPSVPSDIVEQAILLRRAGREREAHQLFLSIADRIQSDPKALHEMAQAKFAIAKSKTDPGALQREAQRRLFQQTEEILRRVLGLASNEDYRRAWASFDLAKTLAELSRPEVEIEQYCSQAISLLPYEKRFADWLRRRQSRLHH